MYNFIYLLEASSGSRIMGFDMRFLAEIGIQWINTLIMILILAKFFYKPVRNFLRNRAEGVSQQLLSASNAENSALSLKADYEGKLGGIEQEREDVLATANRVAKEKTELMLSEAQQDAEKLRNRASNDIKREQERVKDDLKKEVIDLATMLAGRFAAVSLDKKSQDKLITEAISDLGNVKWLR